MIPYLVHHLPSSLSSHRPLYCPYQEKGFIIFPAAKSSITLILHVHCNSFYEKMTLYFYQKAVIFSFLLNVKCFVFDFNVGYKPAELLLGKQPNFPT